MEKQLNRTSIYNGKVIQVVCDNVELDDGKKSKREIVLHNGGACIALEDNGYFYMVRQFRYAFNKEMLEFPAGKIEKGEEPLHAIMREAIEETGYEAVDVISLGSIAPTCGYSSERIYLYYGKVGKQLGQHFDEDENIKLEKYTLKEIEKMIKDGIIDDAKTIAAVYALRNNL